MGARFSLAKSGALNEAELLASSLLTGAGQAALPRLQQLVLTHMCIADVGFSAICVLAARVLGNLRSLMLSHNQITTSKQQNRNNKR